MTRPIICAHVGYSPLTGLSWAVFGFAIGNGLIEHVSSWAIASMRELTLEEVIAAAWEAFQIANGIHPEQKTRSVNAPGGAS